MSNVQDLTKQYCIHLSRVTFSKRKGKVLCEFDKWFQAMPFSGLMYPAMLVTINKWIKFKSMWCVLFSVGFVIWYTDKASNLNGDEEFSAWVHRKFYRMWKWMMFKASTKLSWLVSLWNEQCCKSLAAV